MAPTKARPQLFLDWGASLGLACRCSLNAIEEVPKPATGGSKPAKAADGGGKLAAAGGQMSPAIEQLHRSAMDCMETAERLNPHWWRVPFSRGEMLLARCERENQEGEMLAAPNARAEELRAAAKYFSQAIAMNPSSPDAYRDRAEVLRLQNRLAEAKESAKTACALTLNRQPQSLRALAQIYAEMHNYRDAVSLAHKAAEYSPESRQRKLIAMRDKYIMAMKESTMTEGSLASETPFHYLYVEAATGEKTRGGPAESDDAKPELYFISRSHSAFGE